MQSFDNVSAYDDNNDDNNEDTEGDKKSDRNNPIETIDQAYEWLRTRALPKGVAFLTEGGMNTERIQQDDGGNLGDVRRAIYSLLPSPQRRRFFFEMASTKEGLLRLRRCFGSPPYAFLHPSDMFALNAGAIGVRRTHLSYEHGSPIPPFGQVGNVLQDEVGNEYAIVPNPRRTNDNHLLPLVDAARQGVSAYIALEISLKHQGLIPDPSRELELQESAYFWRLRGRPPRTTLRVKILSTHTSGSRRRTAVLNTRLLSVDIADIKDVDENKESKKRVQTETQKENGKASKQPRLSDDAPPTPEFVTV